MVDETIPTSHKTSKITKIVQSIVISPYVNFYKPIIDYFKQYAIAFSRLKSFKSGNFVKNERIVYGIHGGNFWDIKETV